MVLHTCYPGTQESEAEEWQVWGQPVLYSESLSQNLKNIYFKELAYLIMKANKPKICRMG
jgi:hypothetical protein